MSLSPIALLEAALEDLAGAIQLTQSVGAVTHTPLAASGLDEPVVAKALGRFLVGVLAGAVQHDLELIDAMLPTGPEGRADLLDSVHALVGLDNTFVSDKEIRFRDQVRNAWIGEGLAHALFMIRDRHSSCLVAGPVHALSKPHDIPSIPGLDTVAIYSVDDHPFVAIAEVKSTQDRAVRELKNAAFKFKEIDDSKYGSALRAEIGTLRAVLPDSMKPRVTNAIWMDASCYVPSVVHGEPFDSLKDRDWFRTLNPPVDRRRLLLLQLSGFHAFFDGVADAMRVAVAEVVL